MQDSLLTHGAAVADYGREGRNVCGDDPASGTDGGLQRRVEEVERKLCKIQIRK